MMMMSRHYLMSLVLLVVLVPTGASVLTDHDNRRHDDGGIDRQSRVLEDSTLADDVDDDYTNSTTSTTAAPVAMRTDLVRLSPFDVQVAFTGMDEDKVLTVESIDMDILTVTVTDWMWDSFALKATPSPTSSTTSGLNNETVFDSLALEVSDVTLQTSAATGQTIALLTAQMDGVTLWERPRDIAAVDTKIVELIQRATFLEDDDLLGRLQVIGADLYNVDSTDGGESDASSTASLVIIDVRAFVAPPRDDESTDPPTGGTVQGSSSNNNNQNLEIIIIIAIVVACLAFALLIFAVVWAWRSDRKGGSKRTGSVSGAAATGAAAAGAVKAPSSSKRASRGGSKSDPGGRNIPSGTPVGSDESEVDVSAAAASSGRKSLFGRVSSRKESKSGTAKALPGAASQSNKPETAETQPTKDIGDSLEQPATEFAAGGGGDSVISDDINTSLTAYYKAGVPGYSSYAGAGRPRGGGYGDDAASLSSMDSYGYSLDGYAPSLGTAQAGYPVGPLQAAGQAQITVGDEDEAPAPEEEIEDYVSQA